jgi:hypothetical protein
MARFITTLWLSSGLLVSPPLIASAAAHITLVEPIGRYGSRENESCPCGAGSSRGTCNVLADGSDPNRAADRVTRLEAGSTITLRFEEYVDHGGRFRVAFDESGADHEDFNANVLTDFANPDGVTTNVDEAGFWEVEVTLPDTACDNCTLQLVQSVRDDTVTPLADPAPLISYYACADLELTLLIEPAQAGPDASDAGAHSASDGGQASGCHLAGQLPGPPLRSLLAGPWLLVLALRRRSASLARKRSSSRVTNP